ncbi:MAG: RnfABCDGE type electron transport complex subunit B [Candidatus Thiodiazotropha sp. (ex Dulcina madagascariensis)]|nr:RnfABCDGE type electron transport complex subunit B [Candidatus Thiodiazotropha sp. (ex Dulcina madagascariensis)]MCU7928334.1 RnfABCDGE type electron transport complex subunit B [Candidatus Thiodiazotropha sp. (ex Dulcina madagascariensis)]MCU7937011.1 RnfABCDGE type electron transport complex subunit B [Candidatus Thiodiazotropha sp. (ex Dulcina madagascariensis)]
MDIEIAQNVTTAILFMGVLGLLLSSMLAFANKKLWVFEDPRIDDLEGMLPATNCGACGNAGCRPFAEALISGEVSPAQCTVSSAEMISEIADYLGVESGEVVKRVARLACAGGNHVARQRARYAGLESCRAAALVSGGPKRCSWGCIGLADCAEVCEFDAITMDHHGLPVVDAVKCTACEDCVDICPKDLFSIQPADHRLWVACKNLEDGDAAENDCEVACTACERCVKDSPAGLITIQDNLAVIDYANNGLASPVATERCPTGAIVWLDDDLGPIKGVKAKRIVRNEALPL